MTETRILQNPTPEGGGISHIDHEKELQEFAYIVSHDLTAPARHLKQFTQLLCQRIDEKLSPEEREFADVMLKSADRMQDMLSALLTFSRVLAKEKKLLLVDMNALVDDIKKRVNAGQNGAQPVFDIDDLPSITADKTQIAYVLEQLIDNAVKFCNKEVAPHIRITGSSTDKVHQFRVSDNGVGLSADQRTHAFRLFQKLHGTDYPGLGVGLSISRKIIETHGGRMWIAESSRGTTVAFTLPAGSAC